MNTISLATFNLAQCTSYFTISFSMLNPHKTFSIPSWISKFAFLQTPLILDLPTYKENEEITNVIRKKKNGLALHVHLTKNYYYTTCYKRCRIAQLYRTVNGIFYILSSTRQQLGWHTSLTQRVLSNDLLFVHCSI